MILNAAIYTLIGGLGTLITYLSTDDAAKYINPATLFWTKAAAGSALGGLGALKGFMSESFSKWKADRANGNGNGNGHSKLPEIQTVKP